MLNKKICIKKKDNCSSVFWAEYDLVYYYSDNYIITLYFENFVIKLAFCYSNVFLHIITMICNMLEKFNAIKIKYVLLILNF